MSRASRRASLEARLEARVAEFRSVLLRALKACAGGSYGMFGQNDLADKRLGNVARRLTSADARELLALADEITQLREELGFADPDPLVGRYLAYRAMRGSNVPGEPKLAAQFLAELS